MVLCLLQYTVRDLFLIFDCCQTIEELKFITMGMMVSIAMGMMDNQ
jgi:hypothetical protein